MIWNRKRTSEEILVRAYMSSAKASAIALISLAFLECFMIGLTFMIPSKFQQYLLYYRGLYIFLLVVSITCFLLLRYVEQDFQRRYKLLNGGYPVACALIFFWNIAITYLDALRHGTVDTIAFMTYSLAVPLCFYISVQAYCVIACVADVVMIYLCMNMPGATASLSNLVIFFGFQLLLCVEFFHVRKSLINQIIVSENKSKEVEELSQAQRRFFSNMSHEIRTPINTIIGLNEMILREDASEEIHEDAENVQAASRMLLHLINDILDMSKLESGQMVLNKAPYHIGDMLSDIVGMLCNSAKEKNLEFHVDVSPELPVELFGDEVRIKQILINVLNNAIKYTDKGAVQLEVSCERDETDTAFIFFTVKDTGIGIKKESIPYLFTAFKRLDEKKNQYIEGTGLGLSIVKEMVELMNGEVTVNSIYTKGSTFVVKIPQKIINGECMGELNMKRKRKECGNYLDECSFEAPEAKVLVVDDTTSNLMVVKKLLKETKVQLDTVLSGEEALKKTFEESYHVILMDHKMPYMDGIECLHAIRSQVGGRCQDAKIIALTANVGSSIEALYRKEGFDGYLMKPVTGEQLKSTLYRNLPGNLIIAKEISENIIAEDVAWANIHKKKRTVAITTESVADLPNELLKEYNIAVIPHKVLTEHGLFKDGLEIDTRGLMYLMEDKKTFIETKIPSVEEHESFFSDSLNEANSVIHLAVSEKVHKSGYGLAKKAAESFENVTVIDSAHLSSGQGFMAMKAAQLAQSGALPNEIKTKLEKEKIHVHTSFIVDSLDYLANKKQVPKYIARFVDAMMVHPVLSVKNGKIVVSRLYFGCRKHAWEKYVSSVLKKQGEIDNQILFITYVGMTAKELEMIRDMAEKTMRFEKIYFQKASPSVAANCGPGTFGLIFCEKY